MGQAMVLKWVRVGYSMSCAQSPALGLSSTLIQVLANISWKMSTSNGSGESHTGQNIDQAGVGVFLLFFHLEGRPLRRWERSAQRLGRRLQLHGRLGQRGDAAAAGPQGTGGTRRWRVGSSAPGVAVREPAERSGIVGAGAVGVGGAPGTGGRTGGAIGTVADGTAGGASAAFKVTRTVSFLRGTLDVCLDGTGGWFSFSDMRVRDF